MSVQYKSIGKANMGETSVWHFSKLQTIVLLGLAVGAAIVIYLS